MAAVVLGMRTNAAYLESEHAVPKWQSAHHRQGEMVGDVMFFLAFEVTEHYPLPAAFCFL